MCGRNPISLFVAHYPQCHSNTCLQTHLRHGWGTLSDPALAVAYIMQAANNAGMVESQALASGMKNGGPARGELVLAIYELGNCCSRGLGIEKDTVSGFLFYEIAANLGDGDAMNDTGRCYEEGIGTKKDKVSASARTMNLCVFVFGLPASRRLRPSPISTVLHIYIQENFFRYSAMEQLVKQWC